MCIYSSIYIWLKRPLKLFRRLSLRHFVAPDECCGVERYRIRLPLPQPLVLAFGLSYSSGHFE